MKKRKDGSNKGLKRSEQAALEQKILRLIGKSYSDTGIMLELNLQPHVLRQYKERILWKTRCEWMNRTSADVLSEFANFTRQNIRQLDEAIQAMAAMRRTHTAVTQAIRMRNKMVRDVIRLARQLGLISKRERDFTIDGITFTSPSKQHHVLG